jgi:phage shock protein C
MASARLERSNSNRVIAGVCGGIAEYIAVDATVVRVAFVLGAILTGGLLLLAYIVLVILMPLPGRPVPFTKASATEAAVATGTADPAVTAPSVPDDPVARAAEEERRRTAFGYVLIALGVAFLLGNAGLFRFVQWQQVWPLVLIGIGVLFLVQRARS